MDVAALVDRARLEAERPAGADGARGDARRQLERVAQEFESMLLVQVLRGMRTAGSWETEGGGDTLGAESMYETLDVELASHLARVQGLGLSEQLLKAFDRMDPGAAGSQSQAAHLSRSESLTPHAAGLDAAGAPPPEAGPAPAVSPVSGRVTSAFGWRSDPFTGEARFHRGVDLRAAYGQDVHAAGAGRVIFSGEQGGYGTTVLIEHADGTRTRYAHLSAARVSRGDEVAAGQPVGQAGRSGRATGTHLHFEVIGADGRPIDPRMAGHLGGHGD